MHGHKTNPSKDFGHLTQAQREELDACGLERKKLGLPPIVVEHLPFSLEIAAQPETSTTSIQIAGPTPGPVEDHNVDQIAITASATDSTETLANHSVCKPMDIIDLDVTKLASQDNVEVIIQRLMGKDLRLGVNLKAQIYMMAHNTEKLFDEGLLSREEILDKMQPKCNNM